MIFRIKSLPYSIFVALLAITDTIFVTSSRWSPIAQFFLNFTIVAAFIILTGILNLSFKERVDSGYVFGVAIILLIGSDYIAISGGSVLLSHALLWLIVLLFLAIPAINLKYAKHRSAADIVKIIVWIVFPIIYWIAYVIVRTIIEFAGPW